MIRKLSAAFLLAAALIFVMNISEESAWAGEHWIGTLSMLDGGSSNNRNTLVPFNVPSNSKLSMQPPDGGAWVITDKGTCSPASGGSGACVLLGPTQLFPTSTGGAITVNNSALSDGGSGGTYTGGVVAAECPNGVTNCIVNVFTRSGTE